MEFLLVGGFGALLWFVLGRRISDLTQRMQELVRARNEDREQIAHLTKRLHALEHPEVNAPAPASSAPHVVQPMHSVPLQTRTAPAPPPPTPKVAPPPPAPQPTPPPLQAPAPIPPTPTPVVARQPEPPTLPSETLTDRLRSRLSGQEWEALIGGNWLNKIGVLILVIGIALFLGYEFTHVGPAGRVAIGYAVSLSLLGTGLWWERKTGFALFARGLIGGGWAALYFTTYAIHAVTAAKVVDNPLLATTLLITVAAGMILHSLRYQSETVTGVAYFVAFATLAISESTPYSVLAMLPLAASLLFLAHRFHWHKMALFGLFATYAVCATRPDTGAKLSVAQALFGAYWLLFETFDLLRLRDRDRTTGFRPESLIAPMNALGFFLLSLVKWHKSAPTQFHWALAAGAGLYLCIAFLHARLRPPSSFSSDEDTVDRMAGGGYELAVTLSAVLAAAASVRGLHGPWLCFSLLAEGELLFLAGLRTAENYLRRLGGAAFAFFIAVFVKLAALDQSFGYQLSFAGHQWMGWTPVALSAAVVFYVNRWLRGAAGFVYSSVAAAIVTTVLGFETSFQYLCVAWLCFAAALFELGYLRSLREFRFQSYTVGALGAGVGMVVNGFNADSHWRLPWLPLSISAFILFAWALQVARKADERLDQDERTLVSWATALASVAFSAIVVWKLVPAEYLGLGWLLLGASLFELGFLGSMRQFRLPAYAVAALGTAFGALNGLDGDPYWRMPWLPLSLCAIVHYLWAFQVSRSAGARLPEDERKPVAWATALASAGFALIVVWKLVPAEYLGLGWLTLGTLLFELGLLRAPSQFRLISYPVSLLGCGLIAVEQHVASVAAAAVLMCLMCVQAFRLSSRHCSETERVFCRDGSAALCAAFTMLLADLKAPTPFVALAWMGVALTLIEIGMRSSVRNFRWLGHIASVAVLFRLAVANFDQMSPVFAISERTFVVLPIIAAFYYIWVRCQATEEAILIRGYSYAATLLAVLLCLFEMGQAYSGVGWAVLGLLVYAAGRLRNIVDLRWQGYVISGLAFLWTWGVSLNTAHSPILASVAVVACLYAAQLLTPIARYARTYYLMLASVLMAVLLFYKVSGGLLTVAWGLQALVLLGAGFPLRDRWQRLTGLFLFFVCVLKLFLYDLRNLETVSRIISFIALGLLLVGISWVYTRFRERIQTYL